MHPTSNGTHLNGTSNGRHRTYVPNGAPECVRRRTGARRHFVDEVLVLRTNRESGLAPAHARAFDISATGLGMHSDVRLKHRTRYVVLLRTRSGQSVLVPALCIRCERHPTDGYAVALAFDGPINTCKFVEISALRSEFCLEHINPAALEGDILLVTGDEHLRNELTKQLAETELALTTIPGQRQPRLCLIDPSIADEELSPLEALSPMPPITIVQRTPGQPLPTSVNGFRTRAVLPAPLRLDALLAAVAEFSVLPESAYEIACALPPDSRLRPFAEELAGDLPERASRNAHDPEGVLRLTDEIARQGTVLGYELLAEIASATRGALTGPIGPDARTRVLDAFVSACGSLKP